MSDQKSKPLLRALHGEVVSPSCLWLMRQAGRYLEEYRALRQQAENFLQFCYTPDLAVEATLQPLRRFNLDAAILFSDILVIPDALGQQVAFRQGEGPVLTPIQSTPEVAALDGTRVVENLEPVYEVLRRLSVVLPDHVTLIGFCGAPWTLATYMVEGRGGTDFGRVRDWAYQDPAGFKTMIDVLVKACVDHLSAQIDAGAETVQIFDTWAGVLPEREYYRWVIEPTRAIVDGVRARHGEVPVIGFAKGSGVLYPAYVRETGVSAVGIDAQMPLEWVADRLQPLCTVQGNLDNRLLLNGGPAMDQEVKRILDVLGKGPHIFNLGHGILPTTPVKHVERLLELIKG